MPMRLYRISRETFARDRGAVMGDTSASIVRAMAAAIVVGNQSPVWLNLVEVFEAQASGR